MAGNFLPLELQPYADQIISVAGKTLAIGNLVYASQEDLYSTCAMIPTTTLAANQSVRIWQLKPGETGQGFTTALSETETNNENGDRFQGNEVYVAVGVGFEFYATSGAGSTAPIFSTAADFAAAANDVNLSPSDIQGLGQICFWTHKVGAGPERIKGKLVQYPFGGGTWCAGVGYTGTAPDLISPLAQNGGPFVPMRRFSSAIVFPPNIDVIFRIKTGTISQTLDSQNNAIATVGNFRGFRMTLPA